MFTMRTEHRFNPSIARAASPCAFTRVAAVILFVLVQRSHDGGDGEANDDRAHRRRDSRGSAGAARMADGIVQIERLINSSPQFAGREVHVKAFPGGFPADLTALEDADTVLLYFSGIPRHPLADAAHRKVFADLMARGVGLISLHQSFTVPADSSDIPFAEWLGATRVGMVDRTSELTRVEISGASHAVGSGLKPFMLFDEFYPTITFSGRAKVTPILSATSTSSPRASPGTLSCSRNPPPPE